jgi:prepilin-type N-terminal cleavage/methylation domain-containing protein
MKRNEGFTLIELLIVIAIIALLMGILVPALSRAREQSKRAVCGHNVKQIGIAVIAYTGDNDDLMPWYGSKNATSDDYHPYAVFRSNHSGDSQTYYQSSSPCWCGLKGRPLPLKLGCLFARGYIGDGKILYCPSNRDPQYRYESYTKSDPSISGLTNAWGMPHQVYNLQATPAKNDWVRMGYGYYPIDETIKNQPLMVPSGDSYVPQYTARRFSLLSRKNPYVTDVIWTRNDISHKSGIDGGTNHVKNAGINALFKDGHVRYVRDETVTVEATQQKQKLFDNSFWNLWDPPGEADPPDDVDARYIFYNIYHMIQP